MKKAVLLTIWLLVVVCGRCFGREAPLANADKMGLHAKSIEQVLRLQEDQVDVATAALIISEYWSDMVNGYRYLDRLDNMAYEIRESLRARKIGADYRAIQVINDYLFVKQGFKSVAEVTDPNDLFLHHVMDKTRGYCLSLSILYLALAERLGLPMYGVVAPGHFFVRYDDGAVRVNIETTSNGGTATDEHYMSKFKVPALGENSIYMRNLNKIETLGCFFNNLGNAYSEVGDTDAARRALEQAVQINPLLAESRMNLGNIYLNLGRVDDAITEYRNALDINPDDAKSHLNLGNAYMEKGWVTDAIGEYNLSMKLDANIPDTHKNLATAYCKNGMFAQALAQLNQAIARDPRDSSLYSWRGDVYSQMGNCKQALAEYDMALKMKPDLALAHYGIAMCLHKAGQVDEAIRAFKKALVIEPDMLAALVNLGSAYVAKEKYDAAIEQYKKAVEVKPGDATILYNLGTAYINKGAFKQATGVYEEALRIDPKMGDAHNGLAYAFYRLKRYDMAWRHLQLAQELGVEIDKELEQAIKRKV
ncbi:MAG TPA: tetratricopeptide repeat protein [Sedimentisphaerales bacterium]|nr:tetratricopeptide repeat protein [Sedimentisphaerales bacterium]